MKEEGQSVQTDHTQKRKSKKAEEVVGWKPFATVQQEERRKALYNGVYYTEDNIESQKPS